MAVGLSAPRGLAPVDGVRLGSCAAGIRYPDRPDLTLLEIAPGSRTAAVFTRNEFCAAPVTVARRHLLSGSPRALVINTGYANAGLGNAGIEDAVGCCAAAARLLGCETGEVLPFSTGVIGERLPVERIRGALPSCRDALDGDGWVAAARAIMTTDTVPKGASRQVEIDGVPVTVTGIAKGAGMIRPDMATMLAFVATDAPLTDDALELTLQRAVARSFNRITVDGDTSTNDACVLVATGRAALPVIDRERREALRALGEAVTAVMTELAQALVRDGEGATKFVTVDVLEGYAEADCERVAFTVANSPLVKTALFASDPNWGRILAAIGRAGVPGLDVSRVGLAINGVRVLTDGALDPAYHEADGRDAMAPEEVTLEISLGLGTARARVWTCDFSFDYVRINAEYRS